MTSDESDAITSYNLDDEPDEEFPKRSYWWSLHRPETYALAALATAIVTVVSLAPAQEIAQAIFFSSNGNSEKHLLLALSGIRLGVALIAILGAVLSIRSEDDDTTWSPPVARAALLVAGLSVLLSAAALITVSLTSDPSQSNF